MGTGLLAPFRIVGALGGDSDTSFRATVSGTRAGRSWVAHLIDVFNSGKSGMPSSSLRRRRRRRMHLHSLPLLDLQAGRSTTSAPFLLPPLRGLARGRFSILGQPSISSISGAHACRIEYSALLGGISCRSSLEYVHTTCFCASVCVMLLRNPGCRCAQASSFCSCQDGALGRVENIVVVCLCVSECMADAHARMC